MKDDKELLESEKQVLLLRRDILHLSKQVAKLNKKHPIRNTLFIALVVFLMVQVLKSTDEPVTSELAPKTALHTTKAQPTTHEEVIYALYGDKTPSGIGGLHGIAGWEGLDRNLGCGTPLYAPIDGTITFAGLDGYNHTEYDTYGNLLKVWPQATMITILGDAGQFEVLHSDMEVIVGQQVMKGDRIATENTIGWSYGCHTHSIWRPNANYTPATLGSNVGDSIAPYYGELRSCSLGTCKLSGYEPMNKNGTFNEGTIQCDGDCSMTASGNATAKLLESDKCYVAAPSDVPFDTRVDIDGIGTCYVADRGGYINHLQQGENDIACISALNAKPPNLQACGGMTTASEEYYWLDIISYGN